MTTVYVLLGCHRKNDVDIETMLGVFTDPLLADYAADTYKIEDRKHKKTGITYCITCINVDEPLL